MALTAKGLRTRQRIIEGTAAHLRGEAGLDVTLDDVRATTRTSKGQIFHYFPGGKDELFLEVARLEAGRVIEEQRPHLDALDSWESWQQWRDAVVARYRAEGAACAMTALTRQVNANSGATAIARTLLENWQGYLRRGIEKMQANGLIGRQLDAEATSAALLASIQGGVVILQTTGLTYHLETALDAAIAQMRANAPALSARE
ncbi:TetR/AcrR family transcriptional regulator [Galbitalea sp. SE-J8]|uniref:TetR/AcrR family transcriptional regulator n=1 Tax=Galbitalea sp. SE-J8 TaxID=3054952 RepID=UPI00259CA3EE|nr:TetR/AcrR family transcriptional regulator [Galbitalea sp. SE-J8]MDM4763043.1 TetR/AcrR family transcriptional regulator [Galbitalea sp. SE-J8]